MYRTNFIKIKYLQLQKKNIATSFFEFVKIIIM